VDWTPIRYQYRMLSTEPLTALYAASDVGLVTPLRDGMNLVAKEYVAARQDGSGVLILSEMAGAARELGEALIVNPNHADEIADAIHYALQMPVEEQMRRNRAMQERIQKFDVVWWADDFLRTLNEVKKEQAQLSHVMLNPTLSDALLEAFHQARERLVMLDYDGTLVPFYPHPDQAVPDADLIELLRHLGSLPHTRTVIISGRSRPSLERWFQSLPIDLAAEHGAWQRDAQCRWISPVTSSHWKESIRPFMQWAANRLAGSFVEEKDFALVWHYRMADPELGRRRAGEVLDTLSTMVSNMDVQVLRGNKVVEVRNASVHKGMVATRLLTERAADFILAAGDDWTDEDMFRMLPPDAWSIKVGTTASLARFSVSSRETLRALLARLSAGGTSP
ncbi:MAG: trehalose-phosphatase, partial [Candidatus Xenobia bacterium]